MALVDGYDLEQAELARITRHLWTALQGGDPQAVARASRQALSFRVPADPFLAEQADLLQSVAAALGEGRWSAAHVRLVDHLDRSLAPRRMPAAAALTA